MGRALPRPEDYPFRIAVDVVESNSDLVCVSIVNNKDGTSRYIYLDYIDCVEFVEGMETIMEKINDKHKRYS